MGAEATIYLVDDDRDVRDLVAISLEQKGHLVSTFESGKPFLANVSHDSYGCVILDIGLPGMSGLEIQAELVAQGLEMPIIFITGAGDVQTSVSALKNGALDFFEKPFQLEKILERVEQALALDQKRRAEKEERADITERFTTLTKREVDIMTHLVKGVADHSNKEVAIELGISHRTVEEYRSRILEKMGALSITHLVGMAKTCGIYQA